MLNFVIMHGEASQAMHGGLLLNDSQSIFMHTWMHACMGLSYLLLELQQECSQACVSLERPTMCKRSFCDGAPWNLGPATAATPHASKASCHTNCTPGPHG